MATADRVAVACRGLGKRFGAARALGGVDLDVRAGTVHALVGGNGAGKSTCLGLIAGRIPPTEGTVTVGETPLGHGDPREARQAGVATIYQELTIVPALSTQANVFLGVPHARGGWLAERRMRDEFVALCRRLDVQLPLDVPAGALSVADQQLLEILRALVSDPRVILFDEPTASLAQHEREVLFRVMRDLRDQGVAILFVSHNLDEVLEIADDVTVFRNGRRVAGGPAAQWTKPGLVAEMLGRPWSGAVTVSGDADRRSQAASALRVAGLAVPGALHPVDLEVGAGEILGVGGLVGSGRTTLLRALAGVAPHAHGACWIGGERTTLPTSAHAARRHGIALISEDRKSAGLLTRMSSMDNVVVSDLRAVSRWGFLSRRAVREAAGRAVEDLSFDLGRLATNAANLSGGNQQKLLLGRWRHCPPRVLLADEPTRGVDIGAKEDILRALRDLAVAGTAVIVVSSELEELVAVADRITVLAEGRQVGELRRDADPISVDAILGMAFRTEQDAA